MNIVFYFTYKKFSFSKANEKGKNQQFLHLDNWHSSTIFNRLLLYYFLLSLLHLLFYFISFKIIWINLNHMNYYFFLQSLFKKKLKTFISIYLFQTSFYFNLIYTFNAEYSPIQNHPKQSHRAFNQLIPTTNKSWRTDAIVQQLPLLELQRIGAHDPTKVSNESFNAKQNRNERKKRSKRRAQQLKPLGKLVSM